MGCSWMDCRGVGGWVGWVGLDGLVGWLVGWVGGWVGGTYLVDGLEELGREVLALCC